MHRSPLKKCLKLRMNDYPRLLPAVTNYSYHYSSAQSLLDIGKKMLRPRTQRNSSIEAYWRLSNYRYIAASAIEAPRNM